MDGAEVGPEAMVAACAFVPAGTQRPARALAVGTPAKVLRTLSDDEVQREREGTEVYHALTRRCLARLHETPPLAELPAGRGHLQLAELRSLTGRAERRQ